MVILGYFCDLTGDLLLIKFILFSVEPFSLTEDPYGIRLHKSEASYLLKKVRFVHLHLIFSSCIRLVHLMSIFSSCIRWFTPCLQRPLANLDTFDLQYQ